MSCCKEKSRKWHLEWKISVWCNSSEIANLKFIKRGKFSHFTFKKIFLSREKTFDSSLKKSSTNNHTKKRRNQSAKLLEISLLFNCWFEFREESRREEKKLLQNAKQRKRFHSRFCLLLYSNCEQWEQKPIMYFIHELLEAPRVMRRLHRKTTLLERDVYELCHFNYWGQLQMNVIENIEELERSFYA